MVPVRSDLPAPEEEPSAAVQLETAIRSLVREELGKPQTQDEPEIVPRASDAGWFLVVVTNSVLLLTLVPDEWFKDPRIEILGKLVPWLGSGLFLVGCTWFRDRFLQIGRQRAFKVGMVITLVVLSLIQLPLFSINIAAAPADAKVLVDSRLLDDPTRHQWLTLGRHEVRVVQSLGEDRNERIFSLSSADLLPGFLGWSPERLRCPLLWKVDFAVPDHPGATLRIESSDGAFDDHFWNSYAETPLVRISDSSDSTALFTLRSNSYAESAMIPVGSYRVTAQVQGCALESQNVRVGPGTDSTVTFETMTCTP